MPIDPVFHKIFDLVATHEEMHEFMNLPVDGPDEGIRSGQAHAGRWFEIHQHSYEEMFEMLPLLLMRSGMFATSELKIGTVGSVFFEIQILSRKRWFHGYCDLSDRAAPDAMRAAIVLWETGDTTNLTRADKLDAIWSFTHRDYRGRISDDGHAASEPTPIHERSILVLEPSAGTVAKRLDDLTDEEIERKLPRRRNRPTDA